MTVAFALAVNVQVLVLLPPLLQAPDQIASRPFDTRRVIEVPAANDAEPVLPVGTLRPAGVDRMVSPPRPVAVTEMVTFCGGGGGGGGGGAAVTVTVAVRVMPL